MKSLRELLAEKAQTNNTQIVENTKNDALKKVFNSKASIEMDDNTPYNYVAPSPITSIKTESSALRDAVKSPQKLSLAEKLALKASNVTTPTIQETKPVEPTGITAPAIPSTRLVPNIATEAKKSLSEILAQKKLQATPVIEVEEQQQTSVATSYADRHNDIVAKEPTEQTETISTNGVDSFNLNILLNEKQQAAVEFGKTGKNFVLMGSAGTGKTTSEREICRAILQSPDIRTTSFKIDSDTRIDAPSVAIVAYTRRAAANSAKAILKDPYLREQLPHNIMTVHALLEFVPDFYMDTNEKGEAVEKFRFLPTRHAGNPLQLTHLIIEESTLLGLDLWQQLYDALPQGCQIILVGDINQLQPVFGASILNYGIKQLPNIELTQVYRQAEGSPIIDTAQAILAGEKVVPHTNANGSVKVISGKSPVEVGQEKTAMALSTMFAQMYETGNYNPDEDMILCPYNKQELGTINMNNNIAEVIAVKEKRTVYELIVGFKKIYLAVGDKVMFNKRDAIITRIETNPAYIGASPKLPSTDLSYHGFYRSGSKSLIELDDLDDMVDSLDYSNYSIDDIDEKGDRKMQSSHSVTLVYDDGYQQTLSAVGELSFPTFQLGYALTCHKAQGSEWNKVFIILHKDQLRNLNREWLYTAVTRAANEVIIIAKEYLLDKIISQQAIKGDSLQAKIDYFNNDINMDATISFDFPN